LKEILKMIKSLILELKVMPISKLKNKLRMELI